jgi:PAS domain S-box-containing protein
MNFWDIVHPSYRERSKDWGTRRQQGEELPSHLELPILRKNGEMRWVDYTAAVIDYLGAKAVLGTGIDITERKHAEEALRNSEEQYRMLVQSANSIILRMDTNGVVKFFNEFSQKFFGYAAEEILGRNVVGTIVPETDSSGRNLAEMIRDIGQRPDQYEFNQNENMRCNGERVWIAWTNKAILIMMAQSAKSSASAMTLPCSNRLRKSCSITRSSFSPWHLSCPLPKSVSVVALQLSSMTALPRTWPSAKSRFLNLGKWLPIITVG